MDLQTSLEALRKKALTAYLVSFGFIIFGMISFMIFAPIGFVLFLVGMALLILWVRKEQKNYTDTYKQSLVRTS